MCGAWELRLWERAAGLADLPTLRGGCSTGLGALSTPDEAMGSKGFHAYISLLLMQAAHSFILHLRQAEWRASWLDGVGAALSASTLGRESRPKGCRRS